MTSHVVDLLPEFLDERLERARRERVLLHLAGCLECRVAHDEMREIWGILPSVLTPVAPLPSLRDRLLVDTRRGRLYPRAPALAAFLDFTEADAKALLDRADDPTEWGGFPVPGVRYMRVRGGPRVAHRQNGLIHIPAGTQFPAHRHLGTELTLVITGTYRDEDGSRFKADAVVPRYPNTAHRFEAEGGVHLFCGLAFENGACEWVDG